MYALNGIIPKSPVLQSKFPFSTVRLKMSPCHDQMNSMKND